MLSRLAQAPLVQSNISGRCRTSSVSWIQCWLSPAVSTTSSLIRLTGEKTCGLAKSNLLLRKQALAPILVQGRADDGGEDQRPAGDGAGGRLLAMHQPDPERIQYHIGERDQHRRHHRHMLGAGREQD